MRKWRSISRLRHLLVLSSILMTFFLISLTSCQTTAPTPMFGPFEQVSQTELERVVVPSSPDDSDPVTITLGEQRQALSDSEQLGETLLVANTQSRDLHRVIQSNNTLYDLYSRQQKAIGLVAGLEIVSAVLIFLLGRNVAH